MTDKSRYTYGWSDPRATYGDPKIEWEPIEYNHKYDWGEYLAYVGMGIGVSMTVAPMAWVGLIKWVLE